MEKRVIDLEIIDDAEDAGVSAISFVDVPAIEKDWMAFKLEQFVEPSKGESEEEYIPRCIAYNVNEGKDPDQAAAICYSMWQNHEVTFDIDPNPCWDGYEPYGLKDDGTPNCIPIKNRKEEFAKVSFDWDGTLATTRGLEHAKRHKLNGDTLYIISARNSVSKGMLDRAKELGIPASRVFATGSNAAKINKIHSLGIEHHMDDNPNVREAIGSIAMDFAGETYTDYPEGAVNNAKRALEWADKNGWGDCGMGPGKARANQLANREPLSEDTIARMSAFERHRQNSDTPYSEGCGKLMWDAWGGDAGIRWAHNKLREIRGGDFSYDTSALPPYTEETPQKKKYFAAEDQQIVVGPAMIPDMEILRKDEEGKPYYVRFSKGVVQRVAEKFMMELRNHDTNIQHDSTDPAHSFVMESWIVENPEDKANSLYGFEVPVGTWMVKMRVQDPETWKQIKAGKLKGFSIEGNFMSSEDYINYQKDKELYDRVIKILKSV
jgi:hypothetical protein